MLKVEVEQVTRYKDTEGKLHETQDAALKAQAIIEICRIMKVDPDYDNHDPDTAGFIIRNSQAIMEILKDIQPC